jgi:hypothetical protein
VGDETGEGAMGSGDEMDIKSERSICESFVGRVAIHQVLGGFDELNVGGNRGLSWRRQEPSKQIRCFKR